jgi:hypothetical protein
MAMAQKRSKCDTRAVLSPFHIIFLVTDRPLPRPRDRQGAFRLSGEERRLDFLNPV